MIMPNYFNWPGKLWLFSDPHFGDRGILKYERNEFNSTEEHDEKIIKAINSKLTEGDTLICLGDLGHNWLNCIPKIKKCGKKILILGNHDNCAKSKYREYFDEVFPGPLFINRFTVLSHEPIPVSEHFINIHGHLHGSILDDNNHINISISMIDYKLFDLDAGTKSLIDKLPRIKAHFLEEWYADKYIFTEKKIEKDCLMYSNGHIIPKHSIGVAIYCAINSDDNWFTNSEDASAFRSYFENREYGIINDDFVVDEGCGPRALSKALFDYWRKYGTRKV